MMNRMKAFSWIVALVWIPLSMSAQTEKAIWCEDNATLYFVYDTNTYAADDTYDGQTVTNVYTGFRNVTYSNNLHAPWYGLRTKLQTVTFTDSFKDFQSNSYSYWFSECSVLTQIVNSSYLDTSESTSMTFMFNGCKALPTIDTSTWNLGKVTNTHRMFYGCSNLNTLDVSGWDVSKVTNFSYMFYSCGKLKSLNVSNWDTGSSTTFEGMFNNCLQLTTLDVSGWDTANVTNMQFMFNTCRALKTIDVSRFKTAKVTTFTNMFGSCYAVTSLTVATDGDVWNTSNATSMEKMFVDCRAVTTLDVSGWDVSKVTTFNQTFTRCYKLATLDVSNWNTGSATITSSMFNDCYKLAALDVSGWDVSKVTTMASMFKNCYSLTSLDITSWNTATALLNLSNAFSGLTALTSLDVSHLATDLVTNMTGIFSASTRLTSLTFGADFNTSQLSAGDDAFKDCTNLRYIDFYACDGSKVTLSSVDRQSGMFNGTPATTVIYLPEGNGNVTTVQNVVYTGGGGLRCPDYYSEDKVDVELPRAFQANRAQYTRAIAAGTQHGTTILPYDFATNDDVQCYTLSDEYVDVMHFDDAASVPAHKPFAFKKKDSAATSVPFVVEDEDEAFGITVNATRDTSADPGAYTDDTEATTLSGWTARGYYVAETVADWASTYYIAADRFYKATAALTLYPHRTTYYSPLGWQKHTGTSTKYATLSMGPDDLLPTAIEEAQQRLEERLATAIYDPQGCRREALCKGLNIVCDQDGQVRKIFKK